MAVYFEDWIVYSLLRKHIQWLRMMLESVDKYNFPSILEKCTFVTQISILLGHGVCKDCIKVNMDNIKIIIDLKPPVNKKQIKN